MSSVYRRLKTIVINWWSWGIDYLYVAYWQTVGFFIRPDPTVYQRGSDPTKPAIILIPGIYETWRFMKPVADYLHDNGYAVHVVDQLGYNTGQVEAMADRLNDYLVVSGLQNCIIVAHSKGGLIGKYFMMTYNQTGSVRGMVALNTPFSGSRYARLFPFFAPLRIFSPTSPILTALALNREVNQRIVSIYGQFDPHIPGGSRLDGAQNVQLPTRGHFRIMASPAVHQAALVAVQHLSK